MEYQLFRINFKTPLHLSDPRGDYGYSEKLLHSDTMYAALISALAKTGKLGSISATGDLGCTISSLFPYVNYEQKYRYFFPRPFGNILVDEKEQILKIKELKRIAWLEQPCYEAVLNKQEVEIDDVKGNFIFGHYLSSFHLKEDLMYAQTVPRIAVPRSQAENNGDTRIFYMERIYFPENAGLFFLAHGDTTNLEEALQVLQHEGIGTDRNVGQGFFEFEKEDRFSLNVPNEASHATNLSLFCPTDRNELLETQQSEHARWEILKRGGWINTDGLTGVRKKAVYMFREGSVFQTQCALMGKVNLDLTPKAEGLIVDHTIWRCGRSIFIPIKT
jgi:CRISPR type III-A-associated RAMP protein Csm4